MSTDKSSLIVTQLSRSLKISSTISLLSLRCQDFVSTPYIMLLYQVAIFFAVLVTAGETAPTASSADSQQSAVSTPAVKAVSDAVASQVPLMPPNTADPDDPSDQGWVKRWSAIGDSYAAGIGAGTVLDAPCARYDLSYPYLMNYDSRLSSNPSRGFNFLACSGATSPEIAKDQVQHIADGSQLITLSAGGNDVGLSDVLVACVFQYSPVKTPAGQCDAQLKSTGDMIKNDLPGNLDKLLEAVKQKLSKDGTIYYTAYGKFFDATAPQCDKITWAFASALANKPYLTADRRKQMNNLVDATNQVIQDAVKKAGDQVVYVNYDNYFANIGGRFCEAAVTEPDPNRPLLLFYEYDTDDTKIDGSSSSGGGHTELKAVDPKPSNATDNTIAPSSSPAKTANPKSTTALLHRDLSARDSTNTKPMKSDVASSSEFKVAQTNFFRQNTTNAYGEKGVISDLFLADMHKRVFHPRPLGYQIIANLIFYKMAERRAKILNVQIPPEVLKLSGSCPVNAPPPPAPRDKCKDDFQNVPCTSRGCNGQNGICADGDFKGCGCSGATATGCAACGGIPGYRGNPGVCTTGPLKGSPCAG